MLTERGRKARAELGSAEAKLARNPDDAEAVDLVAERRRTYRYVVAEDYIARLVAEAPVLDAEQRDKLALLLRGEAA